MTNSSDDDQVLQESHGKKMPVAVKPKQKRAVQSNRHCLYKAVSDYVTQFKMPPGRKDELDFVWIHQHCSGHYADKTPKALSRIWHQDVCRTQPEIYQACMEGSYGQMLASLAKLQGSDGILQSVGPEKTDKNIRMARVRKLEAESKLTEARAKMLELSVMDKHLGLNAKLAKMIRKKIPIPKQYNKWVEDEGLEAFVHDNPVTGSHGSSDSSESDFGAPASGNNEGDDAYGDDGNNEGDDADANGDDGNNEGDDANGDGNGGGGEAIENAEEDEHPDGAGAGAEGGGGGDENEEPEQPQADQPENSEAGRAKVKGKKRHRVQSDLDGDLDHAMIATTSTAASVMAVAEEQQPRSRHRNKIINNKAGKMAINYKL